MQKKNLSASLLMPGNAERFYGMLKIQGDCQNPVPKMLSAGTNVRKGFQGFLHQALM